MSNNAAKMREALRELIVAVCDYHENANSLYYGKDIRSVIAVQLNNAREALSIPLRNCDVGLVEEQAKRYQEFCDESQTDEDYCSMCARCSLKKEKNCAITWANMPYESEAK